MKDELHDALYDVWIFETCMGIPFLEWLEKHAIKQAATITHLETVIKQQAEQIALLGSVVSEYVGGEE